MSGSGASIATLKALVEAFNAHDLDRIMSFFADDAVLEMPRGPDPWGRRQIGAAAVREGLRSRLEGLPDVHYGEDIRQPHGPRRLWLCWCAGAEAHGPLGDMAGAMP